MSRPMVFKAKLFRYPGPGGWTSARIPKRHAPPARLARWRTFWLRTQPVSVQTRQVSRHRDGGEVEDLRWLVQRLFRRFGALASDATPCGMPISIPHAHALMLLLGRGELSQQELGGELCIDKSNVARLCAKMADAGHVTQRPADRDGRSRIVALTAKGERVARQVESASASRFGAVLHGLPEKTRPIVLTALQHLLASVEALPRSPTPQERTAR